MELRKSSNREADAILPVEGSTEGATKVDLAPAVPSESKISARSHTLSAREPGDLESALSPVGDKEARQGRSHNPRPIAPEKSDARVVPTWKKSTNLRVTPEESMEGRRTAKGKLASRNASRAQDRTDAPTCLKRVGHKASTERKARFTNLLSHLKVPLLKHAY